MRRRWPTGSLPRRSRRRARWWPWPSRSDRAPALTRVEQLLGLGRTLRAGLVFIERRVAVLPGLEDRVADGPGGLHLVVAGEQRGVPAHRVEDQPLVGLGRLRHE